MPKPVHLLFRKFLSKMNRFRANFPISFMCIMLLSTAGAVAQGTPAPARSESQAQVVVSTGVHLVEDQGADTAALIVDMSAEVPLRHEVLSNPPRIAIDLENLVFVAAAARTQTRAMGPVAGLRAGLFLAGQSRIIIDLVRPALVDRVDFVRQGRTVRLVVQLRGTTPEKFAADAQRDLEARRRRRGEGVVASAPARTDGRPVIVIDPGHGGIDPGASGPKGEPEKEIVLAFARLLRERLLKSGRVAVEMTRDDDRFLTLKERVDFARSRSAALFVSLHADVLTGEPDVRGASVYTLSERASDAAAARAAENENRADLAAGLDPDDEARGGVESILFDLARRETRVFSQIAARDAVAAIRDGFRLHKTPLRGAGFRVLRAPDLPSILIELGYLSNADDLAALNDPAVRARLAETLGTALERFVLAERVSP
jgi:N-acetylmuramoyl-L-alanine amidase